MSRIRNMIGGSIGSLGLLVMLGSLGSCASRPFSNTPGDGYLPRQSLTSVLLDVDRSRICDDASYGWSCYGTNVTARGSSSREARETAAYLVSPLEIPLALGLMVLGGSVAGYTRKEEDPYQ